MLERDIVLKRKHQFIYSGEKENSIRINVAHIDATMHLGGIIGQWFIERHHESGCNLYLFGRIGIGKSTLVKGILEEFQGASETPSFSSSIVKHYNTIPRCVVIDHWAYAKRMHNEYKRQIIAEPAEVFISESSERISPEEFLSDRIEIELLSTEKIANVETQRETKKGAFTRVKSEYARIATVCAYGTNVGIIDKIKEDMNYAIISSLQ